MSVFFLQLNCIDPAKSESDRIIRPMGAVVGILERTSDLLTPFHFRPCGRGESYRLECQEQVFHGKIVAKNSASRVIAHVP